MRRSWLVLLLAACSPSTDAGTGETTSSSSSSASTDSSGAPTDGGDSDVTGGALTSSGAPDDSTSDSGETGLLPPVCGDGDVELRTDPEVALLAGCEQIGGDLVLSGTVSDLTPLASLRHVGGRLRTGSPKPPLTTLTGLEGLESVGEISLEDINIVDLAPLAGLTEIPGGVTLYHMAELTSLEGLHNVASIGGFLSIEINKKLADLDGLRNLESIGGGLRFYFLPEVTSLAGLKSLTIVGDPDGEPAVVDFNTMPGLTSLAGLAIAWHGANDVRIRHAAVSDFGGLAGATELYSLYLASDHEVTSLTGLESLAVVHDSLLLASLSSLENIGALAGLQSVGRLNIYYNTKVTSLAPLTGLTEASQIYLLDTAVIDFDLPSLTQVGSVALAENSALIGLSCLAGVTSMEAFTMTENHAIQNLADLSALVSVAKNFAIIDNDGLTSIAEVAALTNVGTDIIVTYNGELLQTDAEAWGMQIAVGEQRKIAANKGAGPPFDPCPWIDDGTCDEGLCAEGSDGFDCEGGE